jgi:integrase
MTRLGFGEGTVEPNGRGFRVRVRVAGKRPSLGTFATEEEAHAIRKGFLAAQAQGIVPTGELTLEAWGKTWLDDREKVRKLRSIKDDRSRWSCHVMKAPFAKYPIKAIERAHLKAWLKDLAKGDLDWQTRKHCLNLVRKSLADAVEDELLERNPAIGLKIEKPPEKLQATEWTYLLPAEQGVLRTCKVPAPTPLQALICEAERLIALIALGTGIRQGEQWNLELSDVHIDDPHPWIYIRWGSKGKPPKNGKTRRVDLFGIGLAAFKEWLAILPKYAPKNRFKLAFPTQRGYRRGPSKQPRTWSLLLKSANLLGPVRHDRRDVRWHDLRHSCASSLIAGWWGKRWTLEEVRDLLGHSSVKVTERYAHLAPSVISNTAAATLGPNLVLGVASHATNSPVISGRDTQESNLRPSAPEAQDEANDFSSFELNRATFRANFGRYVQALKNRNRFSNRYAVEALEAADEALKVAAAMLGVDEVQGTGT